MHGWVRRPAVSTSQLLSLDIRPLRLNLLHYASTLPSFQSIHHPKNWNKILHKVVVLLDEQKRSVEMSGYREMVKCMINLTQKNTSTQLNTN